MPHSYATDKENKSQFIFFICGIGMNCGGNQELVGPLNVLENDDVSTCWNVYNCEHMLKCIQL